MPHTKLGFLAVAGVGFVATANSKTEHVASDAAPISPSIPAFTEHHHEGDRRS